MWKKEEAKPQGTPEISTGTISPAIVTSSNPSVPISPRATACFSQGIKIKGDVLGKEDMFVDGQVEGKLELTGASVTIGPNAKIKADISARELIVRGEVLGKLAGKDRVQLWSTAHVEGEVLTDRLAIEDGALFRGRVEAGKSQAKSKEGRAAASGSGGAAISGTSSLTSGTATV